MSTSARNALEVDTLPGQKIFNVLNVAQVLQLQTQSPAAEFAVRGHIRADQSVSNTCTHLQISRFTWDDDRADEIMINKMAYMRVYQGAVLCRQGDVADRFYVCITGECEVFVEEKKVGMIRSLDYFGESCFVPRQSAAHEVGGEETIRHSTQ